MDDYTVVIAMANRPGWKIEFEHETETVGQLARRLGIRVNSLSRMLRREDCPRFDGVISKRGIECVVCDPILEQWIKSRKREKRIL